MYFNLIVRWTLYNLKQSSIFMFQSDCALCMIQIKDKLLYLYLNLIVRYTWYRLKTSYYISISTQLVEETTDLPQVTDKMNHLMLYRIHLLYVVIGTDCICSSASNYHMITTTTVPSIISEQGAIFWSKTEKIIFEDINGVIRSRKSKKDRHYNDQKNKYEEQTMIYKTLHRKLDLEQHKTH